MDSGSTVVIDLVVVKTQSGVFLELVSSRDLESNLAALSLACS